MSGTSRPAMPTSGQRRINAKRNQRAAYWTAHCTVKVLIGGELLPQVDRLVQLLGDGARVYRSTPRVHGWVVELDVHIPGAPHGAYRANPRFGTTWDGRNAHPTLLGTDWVDADGRILPAPERCSLETAIAGHTHEDECVQADAPGWLVDLQRGDHIPYQRAGLKRNRP